MRRFRLKEGKHHHNGQTFRQGDVFEAEEDLATRFPGRFEELPQESQQTAQQGPEDAEDGEGAAPRRKRKK